MFFYLNMNKHVLACIYKNQNAMRWLYCKPFYIILWPYNLLKILIMKSILTNLINSGGNQIQVCRVTVAVLYFAPQQWEFVHCGFVQRGFVQRGILSPDFHVIERRLYRGTKNYNVPIISCW
jgi:hypothetical protein